MSALQNNFLYRSLSLIRTFHANQLKDEAFRKARPKYELDEMLIGKVKILPNRNMLLEHFPKGGRIAEIGVFLGDFSEQILERCRPEKLYLIDPWAPGTGRYSDLHAQVAERFKDRPCVEIFRGYSGEMLGAIPDASLDVAYIDAAHDFDNVSNDLRTVESKIVPGGIIAGDDYTRWSGNGLHRWGVVEAVNAFCNERRWEMIFLTHESGRHVNYALRKALR